MSTIQYDLGGGATFALPAHIAVKQLLDQLQAQTVPGTRLTQYQIGQYAPGQGGIFVGNILGDDGVTYGLVMGAEQDIGKAKWGPDGERDLSSWDGMSNTNRLRNECPAAKLASDYERDGHVDFYLPAQRELMIARANVPHLFAKGVYWTSTPYGSDGAWAVHFEYGGVLIGYRGREFRVRPFRRFTY